jgi:hypothetical protein
MANRNWDELNRSAKIMTVTKIGLIGAVGVAAIIISKKAITKMTAEAISDVISPLMKDAPETTLEDLEAEIQ